MTDEPLSQRLRDLERRQDRDQREIRDAIVSIRESLAKLANVEDQNTRILNELTDHNKRIQAVEKDTAVHGSRIGLHSWGLGVVAVAIIGAIVKAAAGAL